VSPAGRAGWLASLALAALSGCATAPAALDVRYPESEVRPAMLSSVPPRRIGLAPVVDRRPETARIGSRPKTGEPIQTSRRVPDIVGDALALELGRNGHLVGPGPGDAVMTVDVLEFWLDVIPGYTHAQYVGRVAIAVRIADGDSGAVVFTRQYVGSRRREEDKPSADTWRQVMETALSRAMRDLATDPDLVSALARYPSTARSR